MKNKVKTTTTTIIIIIMIIIIINNEDEDEEEAGGRGWMRIVRMMIMVMYLIAISIEHLVRKPFPLIIAFVLIHIHDS